MNYGQYRELDELWLPKIPSHWRNRKIKYTFGERTEKGFPDEPLLVASQNMGVVPKGVYGNRTVEATKDLHNLKLVRIGDFVISLRSFQGGVEYAYYRGIISPAYTVMIPNENISGGYFRYLAKSRLFIELLQMCVTGIREGQNIDYSKLKNHHIPIPSRSEQDQIVRYLDWKVSQINKLINAKKNQIVLLQEQKRAVIEESIYSRDYPKVRIKELFALIDERNHLSPSEVRLLSLYSSFGVKPTDEIEKTTGNKSVTVENYKIVKSQDIIVNIILCWQGAIGLSAFDGVTSPAYDVYRAKTKDIDVAFYHYLFRTQRFGDDCYKVGHGIMKMRWRVYSDEFTAIEVPLPPLHEQTGIVKAIEKKISVIGYAIKKIQTEISLLHEYRTRLISDVITGKMDVRGIVVQECETVEEAAIDETSQDRDEPNDTEEE